MSDGIPGDEKETPRGTDEGRPISNRLLAAGIARGIFAVGDEKERTVQRIQFIGGTYPDKEIPLGGLCENALVEVIEEILRYPVPANAVFSGATRKP